MSDKEDNKKSPERPSVSPTPEDPVPEVQIDSPVETPPLESPELEGAVGGEEKPGFIKKVKKSLNKLKKKLSPGKGEACLEEEETPMNQTKLFVKLEKSPVKSESFMDQLFHLGRKSPQKGTADDHPTPDPQKPLYYPPFGGVTTRPQGMVIDSVEDYIKVARTTETSSVDASSSLNSVEDLPEDPVPAPKQSDEDTPPKDKDPKGE